MMRIGVRARTVGARVRGLTEHLAVREIQLERSGRQAKLIGSDERCRQALAYVKAQDQLLTDAG
jgi:hypothetical protein